MSSSTVRTLPRQRVSATLLDALATHSLVVLTAPMGYGKTTAALDLKEQIGKRFFYLPIKLGYRNIDYLWDDVCARLAEQRATNVRALKRMDFPNEEARLYHGMTICRKYIFETPTLVVVDDYHHITAPEFDRFTEALVLEEIPGLNLLILGRSKPSISLEYLQIKGHAAVFGHELLAFSADETRRLFQMAGEHDQQLAETAREFCEGWAAALRLCLQSYLANGVIEPVKNVERLLTEAFFSSYPEEDQRLLLQLSTLDEFTAKQAAFLSDDPSAPFRLRALYEHNAFLNYSPETDTYTMHGFFRQFLRNSLHENRLPACRGIDMSLLYRRAGECCILSGDHLQALRLFARAGRDEDLLRILQMFESPDEGVFIAFDPEGIAAIIEDIPWSIRVMSPVGYLGFIHRYMVRVNREAASALFQEAERRFLDEDPFPEDMKKTIQGEMELIRAVQSFNDIRAMGLCYEKAYSFLGGNSHLVGEDMFWTFHCPHSALLYLREPGGYEELLEVVSHSLPYFQNLSAGSNAGAVELLTAEHLLETEGPQNALHLLLKAEYKADNARQYPSLVAIAFTKARVHLAQGRAEQALQSIKDLYPPVMQLANPLLMQSLDACRAYIAAVCGRTDEIPLWLHSPSPPRSLFHQTPPFTTLVRGQAIMALNDWTRLEAFAEETEKKTASLHSVFMRLHLLLFKAVAAIRTHLHNPAHAEHCLTQALELAAQDGIVTSIAEYGSYLYPLLQRFLHLHPHRKDYVIMSRLTKKYASLEKNKPLQLTVRERHIMEMVALGSSNRDIGVKLGITSGSVANALSRIYSKMGVGSRIEGIGKWTQEMAMQKRTTTE